MLSVKFNQEKVLRPVIEAISDVRSRYHEKREDALNEAENRLRNTLSIEEALGTWAFSIRLTQVKFDVLLAWKDQWSHDPQRAGGWDWESYQKKLLTKPKRFEVAIWHGAVLCGLAMGLPNRSKRKMAISLLEGRAPPHPLHTYVAFCAVEAAALYGYLLGCEELRLRKPLPRALRSYRALGFDLPSGYSYPEDPNQVDETLHPPYCYRQIPT